MIATYKPLRVEIFDNTEHLTIEQVKAVTGCDLLFNGSLFNMSNFKPCCDIKDDGEWLNNDQWGYWGYGWNTGELPRVMATADAMNVDNFLSCIWAIQDGEKVSLDNYASGIGGIRGRTAFGFKANGEMVVLCVSDGYGALTLTGARDKLFEQGCVNGIILDGGGSSQGIFPNRSIYSKRIVSNYICVWIDRGENGLNIKQHFLTNNDCYKAQRYIKPQGIMVHSTATPGVMSERWLDLWNKPGVSACVHAFVDDKGIYQALPWNMRGWHGGGSSNNTHIGFEICEPMGLTYNKYGSAIIDYNPPKGYFDAIWKNATELCAMLCKQYGLDPMTNIVCHSEGYKLGIATNHADVMHWFPKEGKNMDDFRKEVKRIMDGKPIEPVKQKTSEPSAWAKDACDWAVENGIFKGYNGEYTWQEPITRESVAVVLKRFSDNLKCSGGTK